MRYKKFLKDKRLWISLLSLLTFLAGYQLAEKSWNKEIFIYSNPASDTTTSVRNIASLQSTSVRLPSSLRLKDGAPQKKSQKDFVHASYVKHQGSMIHLYLSQFITPAKNGGYTPPCQQYQTIDIVFTAHRELVHGHMPKMNLKAPCVVNTENPALLGPFVIPKQRILTSHIQQQVFHSPLVQPHKGKATLLFSHLGLSWPTEWILTQLRFSNKNNKEDLSINFSSNQPEDYLTLHLK